MFVHGYSSSSLVDGCSVELCTCVRLYLTERVPTSCVYDPTSSDNAVHEKRGRMAGTDTVGDTKYLVAGSNSVLGEYPNGEDSRDLTSVLATANHSSPRSRWSAPSKTPGHTLEGKDSN
ncbi:unnamed protein product, partial [Ectocarpus sp. 12 AP-2014]